MTTALDRLAGGLRSLTVPQQGGLDEAMRRQVGQLAGDIAATTGASVRMRWGTDGVRVRFSGPPELRRAAVRMFGQRLPELKMAVGEQVAELLIRRLR